MRMDKPISGLGQFIRIACLKMIHTENITTARASGFGKTSYGKNTEIKKKVTFTSIARRPRNLHSWQSYAT